MNGVVGSAYITSLLQGELYAIRLACGMVKDMELNRVMIELNSQLAIKLSVSDPPWEVMALVFDVRHFRQQFRFGFSCINRVANDLAHEVASSARRGLLNPNWVSSPPSRVSSVLAIVFFFLVSPVGHVLAFCQ